MVRPTLLALFACPLALIIACGSDGPDPDGGAAGAAAEGGVGAEAGAGGAPGQTGQGGSEAGHAGAGMAGAGGDSETGGGGGVPGGDGGGQAGADAGAGGGAPREIALTVTTSADVRAISPLIYGVNPAHGVACSNASARFTVCRLGGNPWSTYNWENNASNAGADSQLCSENNAELGASDVPAATVTSLVTEAGQNAAAVVTIPVLDYVAADKTAGTPYPLCSGDVRQSGSDYLTTRMRHNQARKGTDFADPPDVSDANVSQDEFLSYLKSRSGTTKVLFTLDNQPELWGQTHIAVHPDHTTYPEVVARNVEYAAMIRDTWPDAEITGYGGYGYYAFLNLQEAPNRPDALFVDYYLAAMQEASTTADKRLIDYLDVHFYSEVEPTPEARVQAPRTLWDPTYVEGSWIGQSYGAIRLIPWLMEKIANYYPDTKLAISSYAYGGIDEISGGIAVADVLGIFGREGVSMAALQPQAGDNTFSVAAFAAFRNYDGAGASFGDESVRATSSDVGSVSIYASTDSQVAGRVVVVAINRSNEASVVNLEVQDSATFTEADVYVLSSVAPELRAAAALTAQSENSFHTTLPAYSVSVIVPKP